MESGSEPARDDDAIRALVAGEGLDSQALEKIVALAGGEAEIAVGLARAVRADVADGSVAAAADVVAEELIAKTAREGLGIDLSGLLRRLAVVGVADRDLLGAGEAEFAALARAGLVVRTEYGLAVREPFRTILDLATSWREPTSHRAVLTHAAAYRRRQLAAAGDPERRSGLFHQALFLSGEATIREMVYPAAAPGPDAVQTATRSDEDDIIRLVDRWAVCGGLDTRACERIFGDWLAMAPENFQVLRDDEGRAVALANVVRVQSRTMPAIEQLLQQHTTLVTADADGAETLFVGLAFGESATAHAAILRHILTAGLRHGRIVVATSFPHYQRLITSLGCHHHGSTTYDVYRCGRDTEVFSQHLTPLALPDWLERLDVAGTPVPDIVRTVRLVRHALEAIDRPDDLARSPLLPTAGLRGVMALRDRLRHEIAVLVDSADPADAEAGRILEAYYLSRGGGHDLLAHRLHVSRATYFRRLDRGLLAVARSLALE